MISDCHTAALVSTAGAIDWCCMPRFDAGSAFGRLLDWERGGFCRVAPRQAATVARQYLEGTLVLATTFQTADAQARVLDCLTVGPEDNGAGWHCRILRVVEGIVGTMTFDVDVQPRFDYGGVKPWLRRHRANQFSAVGGNDALVIEGDMDLQMAGDHDLAGTFAVAAGQRRYLLMAHWAPERIDPDVPAPASPGDMDAALAATTRWWQGWSRQIEAEGPYRSQVETSALALKGLTYAPTGASVAAATTSLPESPGGSRNWDYRYCWVRDSQFTVRSLAEVGAVAEAEGARRFLERTAAGSAESLRIMYGVGGERRLPELRLDLQGYQGARPVRTGNAAGDQLQLDVFGYLLELAWRWHQRGHIPDDDYWRFLVSLVERAIHLWQEPDSGIWEMRGAQRHFVHSKVMCWAAVDRGIRLAGACGRPAPLQRWEGARQAIRESVEQHGYDAGRGIFVQAYGSGALDAALLLLPTVDFVAWDDPRLVRTTDAIREELGCRGMLRRYLGDDRLPGTEGTFLACTFWLAECLANQGRVSEARAAFDRASACANDVGLFPEEFAPAPDGEPGSGLALGNVPQALTHLSHISAALSLTRAIGGAAAPQ